MKLLKLVFAFVKKLAAACGWPRPAVEHRMAERFICFAYGSNMLTRRLQARTPSARPESTGFVAGYSLTFEKVSREKSGRRSGKADMKATGQPADRVFGVLFSIAKVEEPKLDEAEGPGYRKSDVDVQTEQGPRRAVAYVAIDTDAALHPYHWYKALVIAGAVEHGLPQDYIDWLWTIESRPDPMPKRKTKLEAEEALRDTGAVWDWYRQAQGE